ncbi:MAG: hypothetical protein R3E39_16110 [Anaerolineae bacterium]
MPRWNSFDSFLTDIANARSDGERQTFADELLDERHEWPWVQGNKAVFVFNSLGARKNVALNMDTIKGDPPFAPFKPLDGTTMWYLVKEILRRMICWIICWQLTIH